jgi:hypothetical protein
MKSSRLQRQIHHLHVICKSSKKCQKALLADASTDLIKCIGDCAHNILKGNVELSASQKKSLLPYRTTFKRLTAKSSTSSKRGILLRQKGGFLSFLIRPVLSLLGGLLGGVNNGK